MNKENVPTTPTFSRKRAKSFATPPSEQQQRQRAPKQARGILKGSAYGGAGDDAHTIAFIPVHSAEKKSTTGSAEKRRKSLKRRVSFASHASVRMFEKPGESPPTTPQQQQAQARQQAQEDGEDGQDSESRPRRSPRRSPAKSPLPRKQDTPARPAQLQTQAQAQLQARSPLAPDAPNDTSFDEITMDLTGIVAAAASAAAGAGGLPQHGTPAPAARAGGKRPSISLGARDLLAADESALDSEESDQDDDNTPAEDDTQAMDMTATISPAAAAVRRRQSRSPAKRPSNASPRRTTRRSVGSPVKPASATVGEGSVLDASLAGAADEEADQQDEDEEEETSMDITQALGQIRAVTPKKSPLRRSVFDDESFAAQNNADETMDMTRVVGNGIVLDLPLLAQASVLEATAEEDEDEDELEAVEGIDGDDMTVNMDETRVFSVSRTTADDATAHTALTVATEEDATQRLFGIDGTATEVDNFTQNMDMTRVYGAGLQPPQPIVCTAAAVAASAVSTGAENAKVTPVKSVGFAWGNFKGSDSPADVSMADVTMDDATVNMDMTAIVPGTLGLAQQGASAEDEEEEEEDEVEVDADESADMDMTQAVPAMLKPRTPTKAQTPVRRMSTGARRSPLKQVVNAAPASPTRSPLNVLATPPRPESPAARPKRASLAASPVPQFGTPKTAVVFAAHDSPEFGAHLVRPATESQLRVSMLKDKIAQLTPSKPSNNAAAARTPVGAKIKTPVAAATAPSPAPQPSPSKIPLFKPTTPAPASAKKAQAVTSPAKPSTPVAAPSKMIEAAADTFDSPRVAALAAQLVAEPLKSLPTLTPSRTPARTPARTPRHAPLSVARTPGTVSRAAPLAPLDPISCDEFLKMTGISFLTGLSTTRRRDTVVAPKLPAAELAESDAPTDGAAAQLAAELVHLPMLEMYQHSCRELTRYIEEGRAVCAEIEADMDDNNPEIFEIYRRTTDPRQRRELDAHFKAAKNHARLSAKGVWYSWRTNLLKGVLQPLERNLERVRAEQKELDAEIAIKQPEYDRLCAEVADLQKELETLTKEQEAYDAIDHEALARDRAEHDELTEKVAELEAALAAGEVEEQQLAATLAQLEADAAAQAEREAAEALERERTRGFSPEEVREMRIQLEQKVAETGVRVVRVDGHAATLRIRDRVHVVAPVAENATAADIELELIDDVDHTGLATDAIAIDERAIMSHRCAQIALVLQESRPVNGGGGSGPPAWSVRRGLGFIRRQIDLALLLCREWRSLRRLHPGAATIDADDNLHLHCEVLLRQSRAKLAVDFALAGLSRRDGADDDNHIATTGDGTRKAERESESEGEEDLTGSMSCRVDVVYGALDGARVQHAVESRLRAIVPSLLAKRHNWLADCVRMPDGL